MYTRKACLIALSSLACAMVATAQTSQTTGAIRGVVKNRSGAPLVDAKITVRSLEAGFTRTTVSDSKGTYLLPLMPVGDYEVTATHPKLQTGRNGRMRVTLGETAVQNFTLDLKEGSATVEVMAQAAAVDTQQVNSTSSISREMVSSIPLNGRNFTDLVQLTPGAVANSQGYRTAVDGARGVQNNLMIDGASYNSNFSGDSRGGTRIPFGFGLDSVREIQVITNAYDAQFGNAAGGIVNAVTKTGTNEFSGMVATQLRPDSLVAKEKPVPYDPYGTINTPTALTRKFSQSEYAANIGGPIIKDVLHYFVNIDYLHASTQSVPSISAGGTGELIPGSFATFFGPGGMGGLNTGMGGNTIGQEKNMPWTDDQKHMTFLARLDWTVNMENHASLRMNSQQYKGLNDIYSGVRQSSDAVSDESTMKFSSVSWVAELESTFGPNLLNDARFQVASEHRPTTPNSLTPAINLPSFYAGGYYIDPRDTDEKTFQLMDTATYVNGDWTLKGGFDWQWIHYKNTYLPYARGEMAFTYWDSANAWFSNDYTTAPTMTYYQDYSVLNGTADFGEKLFATFFNGQYTGLMDKRLTLSAGLRYTRETWDTNPNPNPQLQGLDHMPNSGSMDPRFGFALDVFNNNRTVLRGGFGLFSSPNAAQNVASAIMNNGINLKAYKVTYSAYPGQFTSGLLNEANLIKNNQMVGLSATQVQTLPATSVTSSLIDPKAREAQAHRASLEVEQDLGHGYVFKVKALYSRTYHLQYWENINMVQGDLTTHNALPGSFYNECYLPNTNFFLDRSSTHPGRAVVGGRNLDLASFGDVYLSKYDGRAEYKNISVELNKISATGFAFNSNLTLSSSRDNNSNENATAGSATGSPSDPSNPLQMYRSDNDTPVRLVLNGKLPPVKDFYLSGTLTLTSGLPWSPAYYNDTNQDNLYNDYALGGRNSMRQHYTKTFNLALTRGFYLPKDLRLDLSVQVFNIFNWANQTVANVGTTTALYYAPAPASPAYAAYGQTTGADQKTREVQFNIKLTF